MTMGLDSLWTIEAVNADGQKIVIEYARLEEVSTDGGPWYSRTEFRFSTESYEIYQAPPTFRDVIKKMYPAGELK